MWRTLIRLGLALPVLWALLLPGCALLTKPDNMISVERQEAVDAWARGKMLYLRAVQIAQANCAAGRWPPEECKRAGELHKQAMVLYSEVEAKLATPESRVDWQRVMKLLELALGILL